MIESRIVELAARQLADYDAHDPGTMFAESVQLDVDEAYELQSAVARMRCCRGEQIIGYKVGCTSSKTRAELQIDHSVAGVLYDTERYASGSVLTRAEYAKLAIEGELAVELAHEPTDQDFCEGEIPLCVARVFPVIELHNLVLRSERASAAELIANNALHAGFVAGDGVARQDAVGDPSLAIFANQQLLDQCAGDRLKQTIDSSLKWLSNVMRDRGDQLCAGQVILTGSIPSLLPIEEACRIRVDAPPFGSVTVQID